MPRNITITFGDGSSHVYNNVPDNITPEAIQQRATKDFHKPITNIDGGRGRDSTGGTMEKVPEWGVKNPRLYGLYGAGKELAKTAAEMAALGIGGTGGTAMAGPAGGVAMAGTLYSGVKMAERKLEGDKNTGIEPGDMVAGAAMYFIPRPIGKFMRWTKGKMVPTKEDFEIAKLYKKFGVTPLPSETKAVPSKTLSVLESVLGYSPLSGDVMTRNALEKLGQYNEIRGALVNMGAPQKQLEKVGNAIRLEAKTIIERHEGRATQKSKKLLDDFMGQYGASDSRYSSGQTVGELLDKNRMALSGEVSKKYSEVDAMLGDAGSDKVEISGAIQSKAEELLRNEYQKAPSLRNGKLISILNDWVPKKAIDKETEEQIAALPEKVRWQVLSEVETETIPQYSWRGLDKSRSELLEMVRDQLRANKGMPTNETRVLSDLAEAIDSEMGSVGEKIGGDVGSAIKEARAASRHLHEVYDKDVLGIMHKKPQDVINVALKDPSTFLKIKDAVGTGGLKPIHDVWIQDTLNRSIGKDGFVDGSSILRAIKSMHPEIRSNLLSSTEQKTLSNIASQADFITKQFRGKGKSEVVSFLQTVSGTSNEHVLNAIFKPNNTMNIKLAKKLLPDERMTELTEQALMKVLKTSPEGNILPVQSSKLFKQYEAPLRELLPKDKYGDISDFVRLIQNSKKVEQLAINASQTGQVFVGYQIGQNLMRDPISTIKTMGMPWVLAKMYVSTTARDYLKKAIAHEVQRPEATVNFMKALEIGVADFIQEDKSEME